ncbi:hypothetical protein TeGR_g4048 [Tetraparma gracilis]|jgi:hypothetical protein|uniref:Uncharacterized protein n=1 Tax=Tetraparma gracilis TaxID=2962635 RepID=A0ABQ6MGV5_9STRA|nr:hypothetical protein TeGR_g4048 [Tetraparma gracilis]
MTSSLVLVICAFLATSAYSLSPPAPRRPPPLAFVSKPLLVATLSAALLSPLASPTPAFAAADCLSDCTKNCSKLAPNDKSGYCASTCTDYCAEPDRTDGLEGSKSQDGGEVGILGAVGGTVVDGKDRPPSMKLPGLDFSSAAGQKLIGAGAKQ